MTAIIIDTETTNKDNPQIIEVSYMDVKMYDKKLVSGKVKTERFKPTEKISYGAMAIHHIVESDLVNCPLHNTFKLPENVEYLIGHNIEFDAGAIENSTGKKLNNLKLIDTLVLARKVYPEADSHTLSALYYMIKGESAREELKNAHSAEVDTIILHKIFNQIVDKLNVESFEDLYQISEKEKIPTKMPFGKHEGQLIVDLPMDYKKWIISKKETMNKYVVQAVIESMNIEIKNDETNNTQNVRAELQRKFRG